MLDRRWIRDATERAYRRLSGGEDPAPEELEWIVGIVGRSMRGAPEAYANQAWKREQSRRVEGSLGDPPNVLFQFRTWQRLEVPLIPDRDDRSLAPFRRTDPLEMTALAAGSREQAFRVVGGVIPAGRTFVVETVAIEAWWAEGMSRGNRFVEVKADPWTPIRVAGGGKSVSAVFEGLTLVDCGNERFLEVGADGCTAEIRVTGRLVPTEEARALARAPFRLVRSEGDGFLTGEPVVLQLAAGRSAGTVYLDGANRSVDEVTARSVWGDREDPGSLRACRAHSEGAGAIPPGRSFEVLRVTWRARLIEDDSHSELRISLGKNRLVDVSGREDSNPRGSWDGSVMLVAGRERDLSISAQQGIVEVLVYGRLVDPAR